MKKELKKKLILCGKEIEYKNSYHLTNQQFSEFKIYFGIPLSCATLPIISTIYPDVLCNINNKPRNNYNHLYLGSITTNPEYNKFIVGKVYKIINSTLSEVQQKEDFLILDTEIQTLYEIKAKDLEKLRPDYRGTHHGNKDFMINLN